MEVKDFDVLMHTFLLEPHPLPALHLPADVANRESLAE